MSQPETRTHPARWMTAVGLGGAALVVVVALVAWLVADDSPADLVGLPDPPPETVGGDDVAVSIDRCERVDAVTVATDRYGERRSAGEQGDVLSAEVSGTVTNTGAEPAGYDLVVVLTDGGGRRLDVVATLVPELEPGASAPWTVRSFRVLPTGAAALDCAVAWVARPRVGGVAVPGT